MVKSIALDESGKEKAVLVETSASVLGGRNAVGSMVKLQCGETSFVLSGQFVEWLQSFAVSEGVVSPPSGAPQPLSSSQTKVIGALDKAVGALDSIRAAPSATPIPRNEHPASSSAANPAKSVPPNDPRFPVHDYNDIVKGAVKDIDPARKEQYLDNQVFYSLFGCTKEEFAEQAKWKQTAKKKQLGLF